jgi:deazaflavin-dependent oxidoreductase (nitroreductase family)
VADAGDWNTHLIAEFRANGGKIGGPFEGAPVTVLHHRGRTSGREFLAPVMYLADESDSATIYVFASKSGAPTNPDWYYNLTAAGTGTVEVGTETYGVQVAELAGEERDRVFAEQARRYPGFAGYAEKAAGVRTIPVLALRRR